MTRESETPASGENSKTRGARHTLALEQHHGGALVRYGDGVGNVVARRAGFERDRREIESRRGGLKLGGGGGGAAGMGAAAGAACACYGAGAEFGFLHAPPSGAAIDALESSTSASLHLAAIGSVGGVRSGCCRTPARSASGGRLFVRD
ncbi:MAG: hypothetical protein QM756_32600 [Polyangiaceae bacterium]